MRKKTISTIKNFQLQKNNLVDLRPIVLADFLRPYDRPGAQNKGMQNEIAQNLYRWFLPSISETFRYPPTVGIWDDEVSDSIPVKSIYQSMELEPSVASWVKTYNLSPPAMTLDLLSSTFDGRFILGFELSPFIHSMCNHLGIPYIDIAIHPVRFLRDYMFLIKSNIIEQDDIIDFSIPHSDIIFSAHLKQLELQKSSPLIFDDNSVVLFGQVSLDTALIHNNSVDKLQDYSVQLSQLSNNHNVIYFKPHPYQPNVQKQINFLNRFHNIQIIDHSAYAIMSSMSNISVSAITSGILTEAKFFNKERFALSPAWQCRSSEPAYGLGIFRPNFLKSVLESKYRKDSGSMINSITDSTFKKILGVNWDKTENQYNGITPTLITPDADIPFGNNAAASNMRVGLGWWEPSDDHCWTKSTISRILFRIPVLFNKPVRLKLRLSAMANPENPIKCQLVIGNYVVYANTLKSMRHEHIDITLLPKHTNNTGIVELELHTDSMSSPAVIIENSTDHRRMGLCLHSIGLRGLNNERIVPLGSKINVHTMTCIDPIFHSGWHEPEPHHHGIWSSEVSARLRFSLTTIPITDIDIILNNVRALLSHDVPTNHLSVKIGEETIFQTKLNVNTPGDLKLGGIDLPVTIPRKFFVNTSVIDLEINTLFCISPLAIGIADDPRKLGIMIGGITVHSSVSVLPLRPKAHLCNVLGPVTIGTGLAVMTRNTFNAINAAFDDTPIPPSKQGPRTINVNKLNYEFDTTEEYQLTRYGSLINIICGDVKIVSSLVEENGVEFLNGSYNICYGAWELEKLPEELSETKYIDEYWALSNFIGVAAKNKLNVPVHVFPVPVNLHFPSTFRDRREFGLPTDRFLFLFSFSVDSTVERKNPLGVLKAFHMAFPSNTTSVGLVFKVSMRQPSSLDLQSYSEFKEIAQNDCRIFIIEEKLSTPDNASLYMNCDSYVSLHRAEGFGLTMAEAMGYGKPTIGTGYSGNMDFMSENNSCPVNFEMVNQSGSEYHGQIQMWADPDLDNAAFYMKKLFNDVLYREKISRSGKHTIVKGFSIQNIGNKMVERLAFLHKDNK